MNNTIHAAFYLLAALLFDSCTANSQKAENALDTARLRYPLILVHGIVAHDRASIITFWGRIPQTLESRGVQVFLGNTDAFGDFDSNAEILKDTIDRVLLETGSDKVNIIAHSKGGLDSRYMIWKFNYGHRVASLTTISTPHLGSEIADLLHQQSFAHHGSTRRIMDIVGQLYGDENPAINDLHFLLSTENMQEFNTTVGKDPRVFYQSLYTLLKSSLDDAMFYSSHRYLKNVRGDNDGFISEYSMQWGDTVRKIEGSISHAEIVDYKKRTIRGVHIPDIYVEIIEGLIEKGF